jgi:hypothetical protein
MFCAFTMALLLAGTLLCVLMVATHPALGALQPTLFLRLSRLTIAALALLLALLLTVLLHAP